MPSIGIESYVVKGEPVIPAGFAYLRSTLPGGLPAEVALADSWRLVVVVPTGHARPWLDADPRSIVASSTREHAAFDGGVNAPAPAATRMVVMRGSAVLGAIPMVVGVRTRMTSDVPSPSLLEVVPLSWEITAAAMVGGVNASIRIELAWRAQFTATLPAD